MKSIPYRLSGQAGLTYVAHLATRPDLPGRAAVAFLDDDGQWRGYADDTGHADPDRDTLALMVAILDRIAAQTERSYVHFYPADAEMAIRFRRALAEGEAVPSDFAGEAWATIATAYARQACGISVLGGRGMSTGSRAAHAILLDQDPEATAIVDAQTSDRNTTDEPSQFEHDAPF